MTTGSQTAARAGPDLLSDEEIVARVLAGQPRLFELLVRRCNRRLYRAVRAVLKDDAEVEDVLQGAYLQAFANLAQFEGRASFATWVTRIAVNDAMARSRRAHRETPDGTDADALSSSPLESLTMSTSLSPEQVTSQHEVRVILEQAIDALPEHYRVVFVLRAVEGLSVAETAASLDLLEDTVKTKFFRARALLQEGILARMDATAATAFEFHLTRCDRIVAGVFARLGLGPVPDGRC